MARICLVLRLTPDKGLIIESSADLINFKASIEYMVVDALGLIPSLSLDSVLDKLVATKVSRLTSVWILMKIEKAGHEKLGLRMVADISRNLNRNRDFRTGLVVNRKL